MIAQSIMIEEISGRTIALKGIGKMFFQDGFPISLSVSELKKKNIEVSILHVADECLKNGWSAKTTISKLVADFQDDTEGEKIDVDLLTKFCHAEYEEQREMIFQYLFGCSTDDVRSGKDESPLNWLREKK